ncbi:thermonuclease family protein [Algoriphagus aquimarinus]|uniref:Micrococcal nuclease n=1 Tax=Algoriphagus aquimarinus TaxID=237018 RepID=A0A1I1C3C1_9BACT|nr:thermonuclease family protein [Algoriphagus aquimarinus]SFB55378.1 micrococcal nuclease [Algoriphagus aquimarinus]
MNIKVVNVLQWSIGLFFMFIFSAPSNAQEDFDFLEISKFVDGDTFWVKHPGGEDEKIRFIGVNTPEARNTGRTQVEYFGKEASAYVKELLTGKKVRLEFDVQRYDCYKRTLAYIFLEDGTFLNAHLVKEGYALVATYPPNVKYVDLFVKLGKEARAEGKGLWSDR